MMQVRLHRFRRDAMNVDKFMVVAIYEVTINIQDILP